MDQAAHILYIEDNPDSQRLVSRILENAAYDIKIVPDGESALAYLEHHIPDLILVDIGLPNMDGKFVTKLIREQKGFHKIPVVAITAHVLRSDRESILASGCNGYIPKPINVDKFQEEISKYMQVKLD
ncbi:MAG: response regulator [Anaerolineae bacterium]